MNPNAILRIRHVADAVLAAIPSDTQDEDGIAALYDMAQAASDPPAWVLLLGSNDARAALERAVEATSEYTIDGWEDDAARRAFNEFNDEDNA
jgi:hypothetical protein